MPKYILNASNANIGVPSSSLQTVGWQENQVLTSQDQNTFVSAYNWTGHYQSIFSTNNNNLTVPDSGSFCYSFQFIQLNNASGTNVVIDLSAPFPAIDVGQTIEIWNDSANVSTIKTSASAAPGNILYPIQPDELIRIKVMSVDPVSGYFIILNDKESKTTVKVGSFQDALYTNETISGYYQRGWLLYGKSIGSASSGADYSDNRLLVLFNTLWSNVASATLSGGRGASAIADWNANKKLTPSEDGAAAGTVLCQYSSGVENFNAPGLIFGDFAVSLTAAQNGPHDHDLPPIIIPATGRFTQDSGGVAESYNSKTKISGEGAPHNNTQPTMSVGRMIRGF